MRKGSNLLLKLQRNGVLLVIGSWEKFKRKKNAPLEGGALTICYRNIDVRLCPPGLTARFGFSEIAGHSTVSPIIFLAVPRDTIVFIIISAVWPGARRIPG